MSESASEAADAVACSRLYYAKRSVDGSGGEMKIMVAVAGGAKDAPHDQMKHRKKTSPIQHGFNVILFLKYLGTRRSQNGRDAVGEVMILIS